MHIRHTHPVNTVISNSWLVWEGGSAGQPVHLTVHSITVAHKLHQEYQPAWAGCRLRMQTPSSCSSCPRLTFIPFLFCLSFGVYTVKCWTVTCLRETCFRFPQWYILISRWKKNKTHNPSKRPRFFKHPLLTRADKSCSLLLCAIQIHARCTCRYMNAYIPPEEYTHTHQNLLCLYVKVLFKNIHAHTLSRHTRLYSACVLSIVLASSVSLQGMHDSDWCSQ